MNITGGGGGLLIFLRYDGLTVNTERARGPSDSCSLVDHLIVFSLSTLWVVLRVSFFAYAVLHWPVDYLKVPFASDYSVGFLLEIFRAHCLL